MDTAELIEQTRKTADRLRAYAQDSGTGSSGDAAKAQVCEFLRQYAGAKSSFTKEAEAASGHNSYQVATLTAILNSFAEYLGAGLTTGVSPERRAQLDVVSDILEQAYLLLETGHHPASAAMLIGAALEEFLRNWVEASGLPIGNAKTSIDAYAKLLRSAELITKRDVKDITSWAGARNHAAHGEWDQVSDPTRIRLMLEGVNLFMRQNRP